MLTKRRSRFGKALLGLMILVIGPSFSFPQNPGKLSQAVLQCDSPPETCKNPHYVGKAGTCTCFSCEDPDKNNLKLFCTGDVKTKVQLFEDEAAQRKPEVTVGQFHKSFRDRVSYLIDPKRDFDR